LVLELLIEVEGALVVDGGTVQLFSEDFEGGLGGLSYSGELAID